MHVWMYFCFLWMMRYGNSSPRLIMRKLGLDYPPPYGSGYISLSLGSSSEVTHRKLAYYGYLTVLPLGVSSLGGRGGRGRVHQGDSKHEGCVAKKKAGKRWREGHSPIGRTRVGIKHTIETNQLGLSTYLLHHLLHP